MELQNIGETKRLIIRRFREGDKKSFFDLIRDKMASQYAVYDEQFPTGEKELQGVFEYFLESTEFFAVEEKETQSLIGYIALNIVDNVTRNLGYCFHSKKQGNGFAFEAINETIENAKETGIVKLITGTAIENVKSVKLLERTGFREVNKNYASFANDEEGNPIQFFAGEYELLLNSQST